MLSSLNITFSPCPTYLSENQKDFFRLVVKLASDALLLADEYGSEKFTPSLKAAVSTLSHQLEDSAKWQTNPEATFLIILTSWLSDLFRLSLSKYTYKRTTELLCCCLFTDNKKIAEVMTQHYSAIIEEHINQLAKASPENKIDEIRKAAAYLTTIWKDISLSLTNFYARSKI